MPGNSFAQFSISSLVENIPSKCTFKEAGQGYAEVVQNIPSKRIHDLLRGVGCVRPGIVVKQADFLCQHAPPFILNRHFNFVRRGDIILLCVLLMVSPSARYSMKIIPLHGYHDLSVIFNVSAEHEMVRFETCSEQPKFNLQ